MEEYPDSDNMLEVIGISASDKVSTEAASCFKWVRSDTIAAMADDDELHAFLNASSSATISSRTFKRTLRTSREAVDWGAKRTASLTSSTASSKNLKKIFYGRLQNDKKK